MFKTKEELLVNEINSMRFYCKEMIQFILELLENNFDASLNILTIPGINKKIQVSDKTLIEKMKLYLNELQIHNQILHDFTFNVKINQKFNLGYKMPLLTSVIIYTLIY